MERRTRIMATSGPASGSADVLRALIDAGVDSFRVNVAAAAPADHLGRIRAIREAEQAAGRRVEILVDLGGRKVRLVGVPPEGLTLTTGTELLLGAEAPCTPGRLAVDAPELLAAARPGATILLADGAVALTVLPGRLHATVTRGGTLRPRAGVAIPGADLDLPALSEDDLAALDALDLALVDEVALSYVGSAADVESLRAALRARGAACRVVAKIERAQALRDLPAICAAADAVLVARGDLGVELGPWAVPAAQKDITAAAREAGRPVILATHILESMVRGSHPTRAEVNDIANAVWEGVTTLCVTAETAIGHAPVDVVRALDAAIRGAEARATPEGRP
ncbi:MAG: hypothetical protein AMXMBFR64_07680 [Myxococcales bacterium]